jgi:hypothetical protein
MTAPSANLPAELTKLVPAPRQLTDGDQWNVFISYRSVNRLWALNLYDVLRQYGHSVVIDNYVLQAGDLLRGLRDALAASQSAVLVWSSKRDSDWVLQEYNILERQATEKRGFQFVPILLDNSKLPQPFRSRVFLNFSAYPDGPNGGDLLRLLHAVVGQPLTREAARLAVDLDGAAQDAAVRINASIRDARPDRLIQLFEEGGLVWHISSTLGCMGAEGLIRLRRYGEAIALLKMIRDRFTRAVRPKQLHALALARRGWTDDLMLAQAILGELYDQGERDPETLGIYGRTLMDRYAHLQDPRDLAMSRDLYGQAFETAPDDYIFGINAAAKSVMLGTAGDLDKAARYAEAVEKTVVSIPREGDYWMTATVAEVFLIQRKYQDAARLYESANATAPTEMFYHESTWKQACRLMEKLHPSNQERSLIRQAFRHLPDCS